MPQLTTIAQLAGRYGLPIREIQECARKAGVSAKSGSAKLYPAHERKIIEQISVMRRAEESRQRFSREETKIQFATHQPSQSQCEVRQRTDCECCQITLSYQTPHGTSYCTACAGHYEIPNEPLQRTLARLRDHDVRMRNGFIAARGMVDKYREQVRSLHHRLDNWREAAVRIVLDHRDNTDEKGRCKRCGEASCHAMRILADVNPGFVKRVEVLACFDDDDLHHFLHPKRRRDDELLRDDDAEDIG